MKTPMTFSFTCECSREYLRHDLSANYSDIVPLLWECYLSQKDEIRPILLQHEVQGSMAENTKASVKRMARRALSSQANGHDTDREDREARSEICLELVERFCDSNSTSRRENFSELFQKGTAKRLRGKKPLGSIAFKNEPNSKGKRARSIRSRSGFIHERQARKSASELEGRNHSRQTGSLFIAGMGASSRRNMEERQGHLPALREKEKGAKRIAVRHSSHSLFPSKGIEMRDNKSSPSLRALPLLDSQ